MLKGKFTYTEQARMPSMESMARPGYKKGLELSPDETKSLCLICSLKYYLYGYNLHSPTSWTLKLHRKRRDVFDGITSQALLNLCCRESGSAQSVTSNSNFVTKNIFPQTESSYKSESEQINFHHLNPVPKNNQFVFSFCWILGFFKLHTKEKEMVFCWTISYWE